MSIETKTKQCATCNQSKPLTDFYLNRPRNYEPYPKPYCKVCDNKRRSSANSCEMPSRSRTMMKNISYETMEALKADLIKGDASKRSIARKYNIKHATLFWFYNVKIKPLLVAPQNGTAIY